MSELDSHSNANSTKLYNYNESNSESLFLLDSDLPYNQRMFKVTTKSDLSKIFLKRPIILLPGVEPLPDSSEVFSANQNASSISISFNNNLATHAFKRQNGGFPHIPT